MPTTSFPTSERDVGGLFVLGLARALAQRGHHIEVLAPEPDHGRAWCEPAPGVRVRWIPYARPRAVQRTFHRAGAPDNLARDPLAWIGAASFPVALAAALGRARFDAIVSHWGVPSGLVAGAVRGAARHVAIFHSGDVHALHCAPRPIGSAIARAIARSSDELVFASAALRARFCELHVAPRAHVIAMGVETAAELDRDAARAALGVRRFTVLALSRLVPVKGLEHAIAALDGAGDVELVIAGEGPERARLAALGRERPVRFVGTITGAEKARWLAAADALVATSVVLPSGRTEGAPTAIVEALAAGLPVIATDVGGVRELVAHGVAGLVIPAADPAALREAMLRLRRDASLRASLAEGARAAARNRSWPEIAPRIEALITGQGSMRRAPGGG